MTDHLNKGLPKFSRQWITWPGIFEFLDITASESLVLMALMMKSRYDEPLRMFDVGFADLQRASHIKTKHTVRAAVEGLAAKGYVHREYDDGRGRKSAYAILWDKLINDAEAGRIAWVDTRLESVSDNSTEREARFWDSYTPPSDTLPA